MIEYRFRFSKTKPPVSAASQRLAACAPVTALTGLPMAGTRPPNYAWSHGVPQDPHRMTSAYITARSILCYLVPGRLIRADRDSRRLKLAWPAIGLRRCRRFRVLMQLPETS